MPEKTLQEFVDMILARPGATAITLHSVTSQRSKMKVAWFNNGSGEVYKKSRTNGMINYRYEDSINRQRVREGLEANFQAAPRQWGTRIEGTCFLEHNGHFYVTMKVQSAKSPTYVNGPENDASEIEKPGVEFWRASGRSSRQGIENQIINRDFRLDHLTAITIQGQIYDIVQGPIVIPE